MRGIHRWPVDSPRKGPVTRKCFHLMTSCILYAFHHMNLIRSMGAGRHFKVDTLFLRYRESHYRDKTAPSYLYNGNPYTVKMVSLYWDGPLVSTYCTLCCQVRYWPYHWYWPCQCLSCTWFLSLYYISVMGRYQTYMGVDSCYFWSTKHIKV